MASASVASATGRCFPECSRPRTCARWARPDDSRRWALQARSSSAIRVLLPEWSSRRRIDQGTDAIPVQGFCPDLVSVEIAWEHHAVGHSPNPVAVARLVCDLEARRPCPGVLGPDLD